MNRDIRRQLGINYKPIRVGDKVKLNVKVIRGQKGYPQNMFPQYVEWVNTNSKKHFTVISNVHGVCQLQKDNEVFPWTVYESHLQLIREGKN